MRSRALVSILGIMGAVSFVGLLLFVFSGGFGGRGHGMAADVPRSFWLLLFVAPLIVVAMVVGYVLVFPEIGEEKSDEKPSLVQSVEEEGSAIDAVLRVLNDDERSVIEALVAEGGTMLQKDIRWKTGLSRVKTHRILHRLAKRGIVSAEKYYNTNKIMLADWLMREPISTDKAGQARGLHT
jgi:uncharacterized membrane protein